MQIPHCMCLFFFNFSMFAKHLHSVLEMQNIAVGAQTSDEFPYFYTFSQHLYRWKACSDLIYLFHLLIFFFFFFNQTKVECFLRFLQIHLFTVNESQRRINFHPFHMCALVLVTTSILIIIAANKWYLVHSGFCRILHYAILQQLQLN